MAKPTIAVLGAGSWGTALAVLLARNQQNVRLWGRDPQSMQRMDAIRANERYLPGVVFPENLAVFSDLAVTVANVENIVFAVPSSGFHSILMAVMPYLTNSARFILATKGLDPESGFLLHQVVANICQQRHPLAILSGPSFAREVAAGLPTAVTITSNDKAFAKQVSLYFVNEVFRPYTSSDMVGAEVAGAVKNVIAIAVGISDGLGYGANARCALITRGLAEIVRLGIALGGQMETFLGLAGVGDLVLTCTDNQSRNRRFGLAVGQGASKNDAEMQIGQVVEGISNAKRVLRMAENMQIEMPITNQIYLLLYENISPQEAVNALLSRAMKDESS
jgi:glycerol-3-phosphate dehydrogenase (NAD(P)+)